MLDSRQVQLTKYNCNSGWSRINVGLRDYTGTIIPHMETLVKLIKIRKSILELKECGKGQQVCFQDEKSSLICLCLAMW